MLQAVRRDWVELGLHRFAPGGEYDEALSSVKRMMGVNTRWYLEIDYNTVTRDIPLCAQILLS